MGHLIAMHDFQQWKKFTGYNKDTMPTLKEFMDLKILKDTILITDKINNPLLLSNNFKFKKRLMMELFSIESILKARELNITAMPSQNLVSLLKEDGLLFFII